MIENDTIKLLRECDAGTEMGIESIEDVIQNVKSPVFKKSLENCLDEHKKLEREIKQLLDKYHDDGKDPNPVAKGMSWMKTSVKMMMEESDKTVADLMTDGCNMGVKSLNKYLNQYKAADEVSKDIAKRLINLEERYASVAVADLTTFHEDVLATGKRYRDMTANNINHPNDFFARFYAQVILTALLGENYI